MPESKQRRKRRSFNAEFKADAIALCQAGDRTIAQVARDLDLTETALRSWVKKAEAEDLPAPKNELTVSEREELKALRKENQELRRDREILKKAAAFFVRESK